MGSADLWMGIAVLRGLESRRPAGDRLLDDPVSLRLLPPAWRFILGLMGRIGLDRLILARRERQLPGVIGSLLCRTRYIDDALRSALEAGTAQVVILGAGFDTRAYRIAGLETVPVFEVDQAPAQEAKRRALERGDVPIPPSLVFVPVDFDHDDVAAALAGVGFQPDAPTFFIWEGVTQYIGREAVERTLAFLGDAGSGSRVAFSYIRAGVIDGEEASDAERAVMARARRGGAPWQTGLAPAEVPALLERHGLRLLEDVGGEDFQARYLQPAGRDLATLTGERVVLAETGG